MLCVCSAGLLRSPTAANVIHREFGHNTRSCGINDEYALIDYNEVLAEWADEIVVMESWMASLIAEEHQNKVICLAVPDNFPYMDEELQKIIKENYTNASE